MQGPGEKDRGPGTGKGKKDRGTWMVWERDNKNKAILFGYNQSKP